jgi:hypothetical protein
VRIRVNSWLVFRGLNKKTGLVGPGSYGIEVRCGYINLGLPEKWYPTSGEDDGTTCLEEVQV